VWVAYLLARCVWSVSEIVEGTTLARGSANRAKDWLVREGVIGVRHGDSVARALRLRASMTLGADKLPGGRVPTLYDRGPFWQVIGADVDRLEAIQPGRTPDSGSAGASDGRAGAARVHRCELTCSFIAPPGADMTDLLDVSPATADLLQEAGWGPAYWRRPATADRTVIMNGLLRHIGDLTVNGYTWQVTYHRSRNKDWTSATFRLRKESAARLPVADVADVVAWLWEEANNVRTGIETRHVCALEPRTTMEQWAQTLEAARPVESEALTAALNNFASRNPGAPVSITTKAGETFWFDQSPGAGEWEVETTVPNADRLEPILAELTRAAENEWSAEDHHEVTMSEFRALHRKVDALTQMLEVQTT